MIVNHYIELKWNKSNRRKFENKGYEFTGYDNLFLVKSHDLPSSSNIKVRFICDHCNGENQQNEKYKWRKVCDIYNKRKDNKDYCYLCIRKLSGNNIKKGLIVNKKSLIETHPHLIKQWSEKNEDSPEHYTKSSRKIVIWKCSNNHEYRLSISEKARRKNHDYCKYCNSLSEKYPELLVEWNYKKNTISPEEITYGSNRKVWWICEEGHEWEAMVFTRTSKAKTTCPYCTGKKATKENNLEVQYPDIAKEWHPTKNGDLLPQNLTTGSSRSFWWLCKKGHEFKCTIENRINKGTGCGICNESKGEKRINNYLSKNNIKFETQFSFDDLLGLGGRKLKFDFAVFKDNKIYKLIEFDGKFHFEKVYINDSHETTQIHDEIKNKYCSERNIPLIRIPYWKFNDVEKILDEEFALLYT